MEEYPLNPQGNEAIPNYNYQYQMVPRKPMVPGSIATLILAIASLANMAFFGWIPALIAYAQYRKAREAMEAYPELYSETSINMANSGKRMADIGLILGLLGMIVTGVYYYWMFSNAMYHGDYNNYEYLN